MKYWAPINSLGGINGNDPYVNGDPVGGTQGSIPTFQMFEQMLRELVNLTIKAGLTPSAVIDGIQIAQAVQNGKLKYAVDSGTANAMVIALDPIPASLNAGLAVTVLKSAAANTSATPTLAITGVGSAQVIKTAGGAALVSGDLPASTMITFGYDGTAWRLQSAGGSVTSIIDQTITAMLNVKRVVFNGPSSGNWTVPTAGIAGAVRGGRISVKIWGSGGGGGGCQANGKGGCGGNGGDYMEFEMAVTPGANIPYVIPAGGAGGVSGLQGATPSPVTWNGGGFASCSGGLGGAAGTTALPGNVGTDNNPSTVPTNGTLLIGTRGSQGYNFVLGPGGIGGSAGGGGGAGPSASGVGYSGGAPGGGGGAGGGDSGIATNGGPGAPGRIIIEYVEAA